MIFPTHSTIPQPTYQPPAFPRRLLNLLVVPALQLLNFSYTREKKPAAVLAAPTKTPVTHAAPTTAVSNSGVRQAVAGIEAHILAHAGEFKEDKLNRTSMDADDAPHKKRKRSIDNTDGQHVKRQAAMRNVRSQSSPDPINPDPARGEVCRPAQGPSKAQNNREEIFQGDLRPVGYRPRDQRISSQVINISSDEEEDARLTLARYRQRPVGGILPKDSHQDDIVVKSTEMHRRDLGVGLAHYQERLNDHTSYDIISTDFLHYRNNGKDPEGVPDLDRYREDYPQLVRDRSIDYTKPPQGHHAGHLHSPIWRGQTFSPLVCLAIIRVAQSNLPFVNFESALNHLINLGPMDPFPRLPTSSTFVDDVEYQPRPNDLPIKTVFVPHYYLDGRHALGFYVRLSSSHTTVVFTPSSDDDLYRLGLFDFQAVDRGSWEDTIIATNEGEWVGKEDTANWTSLLHWVSHSWVNRLFLTMGGQEDP
ncbi:hypothetical protein K504DRAFT_496866 [Pleomassaria siparia CBS 279.74]|uniref:Uncharacterized protein n=1 Tax=Pleomassaria siparia CBS 279.74 TaxID=1314801 RepID=A0A6G1KQ81_9PLEO|nr:hypothetical protein K504DRAFT_496866 [Pleomassaria siparia CBS 279.74]